MTLDEFRTSSYRFGTRYALKGREVKIVGQYGDTAKVLASYDLDTVTHYQSNNFDIDVSELDI